MSRETALAGLELVIAVGIGVVMVGQAAAGAWKCLRRRLPAVRWC